MSRAIEPCRRNARRAGCAPLAACESFAFLFGFFLCIPRLPLQVLTRERRGILRALPGDYKARRPMSGVSAACLTDVRFRAQLIDIGRRTRPASSRTKTKCMSFLSNTQVPDTYITMAIDV